MSQIDYSIIIPHKNSPDLLKRCLSSIPLRNNIQIVVVDDNSDSSSVNFNDFPGQNDDRVEVVFSKEGLGAGFARNVGLKYAKGKWIIFVDADDYLNPCFDVAIDRFKDSKADVIFFKNTSVFNCSGNASTRGDEMNRRVDVAIQSGDYSLAVLYSSPWQKFFRRDFIESNNIHFNESRWGNDVVFMGRVAAAAERFEASELPIYCLTESDSSIVKDRTLQSRLVRFHQESENVSILKRTKYSNEPTIYYWHFRTWFDIWKKSSIRAVVLLPKAFFVGGRHFCREFINALAK